MVFILIDETADGPVIQAPGLSAEVLTGPPCPRVGLTVTGLSPAQSSTITVWRTVAGEDRAAVRGLRRTSVIDATYVVDYEAPLGRPVTYTLEVAGPVTPPTLVATVTIITDKVWLQDPLDPTTACEVAIHPGNDVIYMASTALTELGYEDPGALVDVMGARYPTYLGGGRRAARGIPLDIATRAIEAANRVRILLDAASPLLVRTVPEISGPLPALAYVRADVVERPQTVFIAGAKTKLTKWSLTGALVQGPSINLLVPTWTYAQVSALYETYAAAAARGGTYLDWMKDPTP